MFKGYLQSINQFENVDDAKNYIKDNLSDIQSSLYCTQYKELVTDEIEIEDIFLDFIDKGLFNIRDNYTAAFIEILADFFERYNHVSSLIKIESLLNEDSLLKKRIEASILFSKINNATTDYFNRFDKIIEILNEALENGEIIYKTTLTFINFYFQAIKSFIRLKRPDLIEEFKQRIEQNKAKCIFLSENIIEKLVIIKTENFEADFILFYDSINAYIKDKGSVRLIEGEILPEDSEYTKAIKKIEHPDFNLIRNVSVNFVSGKDINEKNRLKRALDNGIKIIDNPELLYAYYHAFGKMHYCKIYEATEKIKKEIENKKIDIIDWGCGQALATMVLLEFVKSNALNVQIDKITLIEPSELCLKRGLVHIEAIQYAKIKKVKTICKDLDNVAIEDIDVSKNLKVHLFSNILDIEYFDLNKLIKKVENNKGKNIFICVSPVVNVSRKARLLSFYDHFEKNYDVEFVEQNINTKKENKWKSNKCKCHGSETNHKDNTYLCPWAWTRHEIVFKTKIN